MNNSTIPQPLSIANTGFAELLATNEAGRFLVRIRNTDGSQVEINLDATELRQLGKQLLALMKPMQHGAPRTTAAEEAPYREKAHYFDAVNDLALRLFLQEAERETLALVLWYLKDTALIRRILGNCSQRVGEELKQALEKLIEQGDPDSALKFEAENARLALEQTLQQAKRIAEKCRQIEAEGLGGRTS
jgi:hypothetical protein